MLEIKGVKKSYGEFQLDCSLNIKKKKNNKKIKKKKAGKSTLF